jgi:branched-chain amino acid transport system ATP-binding protein
MSSPALSTHGLQKSFGRTPIIRGVDLTVEAGHRHAVIGPNGAGKSTLFDLISGRIRPTAGTITLKQADITGFSPFAIARKGLSRSFQISNLFPLLSVFENVRCALLWHRGQRYAFWRSVDRAAALNDEADEWIARIGLTDRANAQAGVLTYAEQRALEIGLAVAGGAEVILLDEPTAGMSRSETAGVIELIRRITAGKTLVMVEHDMSVVFSLADRISVLVYGQIILTGTPEEVQASAAVQEAYLGVVKAKT